MARGDHLVVQFGPYTHHGIDLGDGTVIHYGQGLHNKANARVEVVDWAEFCGSQPVRVREDRAEFPAEEVIERAESRLGEADYDVLENNCEHFVNWCRRGSADSRQVNLADALCRRSSAAAAKMVLPRLARRLTSGKVAMCVVGRFALTASLAGDAVQVSTEVVANRMGLDGQRSQALGRRSGALASSSIGYMLGGPPGAAVGFSSWLFGEVIGQTTTDTARRVVCRKVPSV